MLELIYTIQAKIANEGSSIDNIILLLMALFTIFAVGYLVELHNSVK